MQNTKNKAFTLVELLVVITILAIISVVAYQNFGGAVDKAISGRKISDVSTIETSLQQYKVDKNYYPAVAMSGSTNMRGYNTGSTAFPSNTLTVTMKGEEIDTIKSGSGGGAIYGSGSLGQIGAKGTISRDVLTKQYLSQDLYDPELGDIKVNNIKAGKSGKMIEKGIGRYVYAVYKKPKTSTWGNINKKGTSYNLALTIKENGTDKYVTKILGDYDSESCYDDAIYCPDSLIGTFSGAVSPVNASDTMYLTDGQKEGFSSSGSKITNYSSNKPNQGLPYAVNDFAE